jgi:hypothetical protein
VAVRVVRRRRGAKAIEAAYPDAFVADVTSRGSEPWVRLSPFYPHGGIPVPFAGGMESESVEGIWQALKVFAATDVDPGKLAVTTMTGLKRTERRHGKVLGHRAGLHGEELLPYEVARRRIYLPSYRWVLDNRVADLMAELRRVSAEREVVLLDHTTNADVADLSTPLSHAALISRYLDDRWPVESSGRS